MTIESESTADIGWSPEVGTLHVGVLGVNHKSAHLSLREALARSFETCFDPQVSADDKTPRVLLSTCNRTEVYFSTPDLAATHSRLLHQLRQAVGEEFEHALYSYFRGDAFCHLAKVTSGLDSAVTGETEIQGQVKTAYQSALAATELSKPLHFAFQKSLRIGKRVRNDLLVQKGMPDLEGAIHKIASMVHGDLLSTRVLFVGASEINLKILRFFRAKGLRDITLCNRTLERGQEIARQEAAQCIDWEQRVKWPEYDWVVVGTKAPGYLLQPEHLETFSESKKLIIDLSLPRNVNPSVGHQPSVLLLNIDQINHSVDTAQAEATGMVRHAEGAVNDLVHRQLGIYHRREQRRFLYTLVGA